MITAKRRFLIVNVELVDRRNTAFFVMPETESEYVVEIREITILCVSIQMAQ